jgi:acetolactate synthase-1/2/3 large subunit
MPNGSEFIVDFLLRQGVRTVFGYPGAPLLELYEAIRKNNESGDEKLNHILVRHEQGAAFAACGYARATGFPGVCIATSGPGAINLATGIADADLDSVPMLIITGQVGVAEIGRDAFQEADIMGMTIPITKHNYLVKKPELLAPTLEEAWRVLSTGRKGPVLVDISLDVLSAEITDRRETLGRHGDILPRIRENGIPLSVQLPKIAAQLSHAYRPLILAGGGVVSGEASAELSRFAAKYSIPVVVTLPGMGLILDRRVNMLGLTGRFGTPAANAAMDQCDIVIACGTRFSDRTVADFDRFARSHFIIHCDIDYAEISKNVKADLPVVSDAREFFASLCECEINYDPAARESWNEQLRAIKQRTKAPAEEPESRLSCAEVLRALDVVGCERRDCVYIADVGSHQMTAAQRLMPIFERGFITSGGLGAMGFGLPAACGASVALSEWEMPGDPKQIVLICGDGGFQMTAQELSTLACAPMPIKIFIIDNRSLGMISEYQKSRFGGNVFESELKNPDFVGIGRAYGIESKSIDVSCRASLADEIRDILSFPNHMLIRFDID